MQAVPEWRRVLRHAWSIRWLAAAIVLGGAEAAINIADIPGSQGLRIGLAVFGSVCGTGAIFARLMVQKEFDK